MRPMRSARPCSRKPANRATQWAHAAGALGVGVLRRRRSSHRDRFFRRQRQSGPANVHGQEKMRQADIGLGANQGDLEATLNAAVQALGSLEQSKFIASSPFYRSAPIDADGPDYLNAVVRIDT